MRAVYCASCTYRNLRTRMTDTITSRLPQIDAIIISSIIDAFSTSLSNSNQSPSLSSAAAAAAASSLVAFRFCATDNDDDAFAPPAVSSVAFDAATVDDEIPFDIDAAAAAIIINLGSIVVLVDIVVEVVVVAVAFNDPQQMPNSITASTAGSIADTADDDDKNVVGLRRPELGTIEHLPHLAQRWDHISHARCKRASEQARASVRSCLCVRTVWRRRLNCETTTTTTRVSPVVFVYVYSPDATAHVVFRMQIQL